MKIKCIHCGKDFIYIKPTREVAVADHQPIVDMIEIFSKINPTINYGHRGYRKDAEELIKKLGVEKALNTAKFAVSIQGQPYSPTITSPTALKNKLGDLMVFYKKSTSGRTVSVD